MAYAISRNPLNVSRLGRVVVVALPALYMLSSACERQPQGATSVVTDSAGVRIVSNLGQDRELNWQLDQVLRIGGHDQGPQSLVRVSPQGVGTDSGGRLYILDSGDPAVHVFGPTGEHVRSVGRRGGGPGEFMRPAALYVTDAGALRVLDTQKRTFVRFAPDGSVETELRPPDARAGTNARTAVLSSGEIITTVDSGETCPACPLLTTVLVFPTAAEDTGWIEPVDAAVIEWAQPTSFNQVGAAGCPSVGTPPVFWRYPVWRITHGTLLHNGVDSYQIEVLPDVRSPTRNRQSIRRDIPVVKATREFAAAEIGPMVGEFQGVSCNASAEERADQASWADRIPFVRDATLSPDGRIYVLRRAPGQSPPSRLDVFEADGAYLGTLPESFPFPVAWRQSDEIVVIEHDQFNQPYVVVYRIRQ